MGQKKTLERQIAHSAVFAKGITGFTLLDPATSKTLADVQGDRYFTPASNTKIWTLATCLETLGDSVPGLQYSFGKDGRLIARPTGDPTFLHPQFEAWQPVYAWIMRQNANISLKWTPLHRFGPGWAWDDYNASYSAERTCFPFYGNLMEIRKKNGRWESTPRVYLARKEPYFSDRWALTKEGICRSEFPRWFGPETVIIRTAKADSTFQNGFVQSIPMPLEFSYLEDLLADTLAGRERLYVDEFDRAKPVYPWRTIYSVPLDTVLRRMMYESDNQIAEQMLLVCTGVKFDTLQDGLMIPWMLDSVLTTLPQRPKWVDGSGLSRYNLISPQSTAQVLLHLWKKLPRRRLLSLFPAGGVSGTLKEWYAGKTGEPYVFAKSGSMGGVYCLSGYVVCKSGKTLIFSFMHNNFVGSNKPWKEETQRLLEKIRDSH